MHIATNPRITVELEAGADPIRGSVEHADGRRQPFWGWLELIEELRRVAAYEPERLLSEPWASTPAPQADAGGRRRRGQTEEDRR